MNKSYNKALYSELIRPYIDKHCVTLDWPQKGVNFIDIFPLLEEFEFTDFDHCGLPTEDLIFLPEARGFLFYGLLGPSKCIPMRKKKKLPGELVTFDYALEYGTDSISFQIDAVRRHIPEDWDKSEPIPVCYFDDLIATGGSAQAAIQQINSLNVDGYTFKVTTAFFYIELSALGGRQLIEKEGCSVYSVYEY